MNRQTQQLHDLGQSLWLDNISRETLQNGAIASLISDYSVTGLTSNPTIFEKAMGQGNFYDAAISALAREGRAVEDLFFALAVDDLRKAADLFRPAFDASKGIDGWVSLEVSPELVDNTAGTIQAAVSLHAQAGRDNLFIKIPGTPAGLPAIEEAIYRGVPINVTLLFSSEHYVACADAYMRGIERRLNEGKSPVVDSVASLFVSRWDAAVKDAVSPEYQNRLGIAVSMRAYKAYRDLLASGRWKKLEAAGAHPQRLLWASTGTKDPKAPETLYVEALAAPDTVNTMPEKTLKAFAEKGRVGAPMPVDGGHAEAVLEEFRREGVDLEALAAKLQKDGGDSFKKSWHELIGGLSEKVTTLTATSPS